ncbi:glutathione S-transferase [Podospora didyma]|uniref:Glutathione S-transferase n=1 Tax=Podospora didyma TaxID=330526 RepID=A0AAE0NH70_9PEZI|nr:glutathione S-transferase [Podospora didyma]
MSEPTGLIANTGIELLTFGTPNGVKASVLLEELKEAYPKLIPSYTVQTINIMKNTQKEPWYTALNPNGRIPTIVDHNRGGFAVFETFAILSYLTRHYDPEHKFSFPIDSDDYSVCEQWMAWQHGGLGPMQGQANHFKFRIASDNIPYGLQRYQGETERLYGVLDKRLSDRDYLAGPGRGKYSIADIMTVGWANLALFGGLDLAPFPNVRAWVDRIITRPATARGLEIPNGPSGFTNAAQEKAITENEEARAKHAEVRKAIDEAKAQYGYKYASP